MEQWLDSIGPITSSRPFHGRHESNEIEKYIFLIKPWQTFRNKINEKNRPKTTVTEINQKYPEFFLNEIDRSHVGLKTQLLPLWRFKRFTFDIWRIFSTWWASWLTDARLLTNLGSFLTSSPTSASRSLSLLNMTTTTTTRPLTDPGWEPGCAYLHSWKQSELLYNAFRTNVRVWIWSIFQ